jgi:hypothetical protein
MFIDQHDDKCSAPSGAHVADPGVHRAPLERRRKLRTNAINILLLRSKDSESSMSLPLKRFAIVCSLNPKLKDGENALR